MKNLVKNIFISAFVLYSFHGFSQDEKDIKKQIMSKDAKFWNSYNSCNTNTMQEFLSNDVEFYHDKGGITIGAESLINSLKQNLCSNLDLKIRREADSNSIEVYLLEKDNVVYGAILKGNHSFYITKTNEKEFLSGKAKFTHLWLLKDNHWKMTRILSYDHKSEN
jgi:Domain of unknown function (DUF4440)